MYFSFSGQCRRGLAHQKTCQEKALMPALAAMLRTPVITSVTNNNVSILLFSHLESTAKSKDLLQS